MYLAALFYTSASAILYTALVSIVIGEFGSDYMPKSARLSKKVKPFRAGEFERFWIIGNNHGDVFSFFIVVSQFLVW